jgi:hypothetical protein
VVSEGFWRQQQALGNPFLDWGNLCWNPMNIHRERFSFKY